MPMTASFTLYFLWPWSLNNHFFIHFSFSVAGASSALPWFDGLQGSVQAEENHSMTSNSHFRRGQSKVYYASDVWDPGSHEEELARTSFRSSCSDHQDQSRAENSRSYGNNDDFVASLIRRRNGCGDSSNNSASIYQYPGHHHDVHEVHGVHEDCIDEELLEDELDDCADEFIEEPFSLPTYPKPLPLLGHPSRHSVLNRYVLTY